MTETEWLSEESVSALLHAFEDQKGQDSRRLRLFGCACCRRVWHLLEMSTARPVLELAEACADEEVSEATL